MLISLQWICGARNLGHTTQELCTQENKEILKNIFTSLFSHLLKKPHLHNKLWKTWIGKHVQKCTVQMTSMID